MVKMNSELFHAAVNIMRTRDAQLAALDDRLQEDEYLTHSGRKGMKWGGNIFGQVEEAKDRVNKAMNSPAPAARPAAANYGSGMQRSRTGNMSADLKAEQMRRKYGGTEEHYDTGRGAQVREQQRKQREAQAKYGGGSYYDIQKAESEKNAKKNELTRNAKSSAGYHDYSQDQPYRDAREHDRVAMITDPRAVPYNDGSGYHITSDFAHPYDQVGSSSWRGYDTSEFDLENPEERRNAIATNAHDAANYEEKIAKPYFEEKNAERERIDSYKKKYAGSRYTPGEEELARYKKSADIAKKPYEARERANQIRDAREHDRNVLSSDKFSNANVEKATSNHEVSYTTPSGNRITKTQEVPREPEYYKDRQLRRAQNDRGEDLKKILKNIDIWKQKKK